MLKMIHRLFLPAIANKISTLKLLSESSLGAIWFDIIPLFSIPYIIRLIETKNYDGFLNFSYFILLTYTLVWIGHSFLRKWDYQAKYTYFTWVEQTYRKKLILKENLAMDVLGTGKAQSLIQKGIHEWVDALWQIQYQIPKVLLSVISGVYIMINFGFIFVIFFFVYAMISVVGFTYFKKIKLKYDKKINDIEDERNSHSVRVIMSRQEVIFSGKENQEAKQLANYSEKQYQIAKNSAKYDFTSDWFISGIGTVLPFLGVIYILKIHSVNNLDTALVASFIYFASRFAFNMYSLLWIVQQVLEHAPKIQRFWDFLDLVPELKNYETGKEFLHGNGSVEFKNVDFVYDQELLKPKFFQNEENVDEDGDEVFVKNKAILENFNLKIPGGSKLALVGLSGSGKTTIAKLIVGYLRATNGQVKVDGQDIKEISLKSFYKHVGYLTQEPGVFDGTIKQNLLYSMSSTEAEISVEKLNEALIKANCDFVFKLKRGLNTHVGEKGVRLSGGERQRLAIAKLFLKDPDIIILDEPTSALDSFSEEKISQSLEELFKNRTTIIIAHRLQTVKKADRILVIENGKIIEDGTHEGLIKLNGIYYQMLAMQSGF